MKIVGIVVTRDRYSTLVAALRSAIEEGEEWISHIIVIDNASGDDTSRLEQLINERRVKIIHLPNNIGLEPGIAVGIQAALDLEPDAILLFDDDSYFLPGSIKCLVESFWIYGGKVIVNTLPLSDLSGELSSPQLKKGKVLLTKQELITANGGKRYIQTFKVHFNGCLINADCFRRIGFNGMFGEETFGALLYKGGYSIIIDTSSCILHPSVKRYNIKILKLPFGKPIMIWQLPPWKAYQAARESVAKRAVLEPCFLFYVFTLPIIVGVYLIRIFFETDRMTKLPYYFRGLLDGIKVAHFLNHRKLRSL